MIHIYAIVLIIAISLFVKWHFSYWSRRGVKGPTPMPFFGNLFSYFIGRKHFGEIYAEIYRKYTKAAYVGVFKFSTPAILVRDADLIKSVLVENFHSFRANDFQVDEKLDPLLAKNMFFSKIEKWKEYRTQMTPIFTNVKLKAVFPLIQENGEKLVKYIESGPESNNPDGFEAKDLFTLYTVENVASCGFGVEGHAFTDKNAPFVTYSKKVFETSFMNNLRFMLTLFIPNISKILNISFLNKEIDLWLRNVVSQVLQSREKDPTVRRPDFMQFLIDTSDKWNKDLEVTVAHSLTFLTDGYETSSTMLAYCLYQLAVNPRIQRHAQREIDAAISSNGGKLTEEGIQSLIYLEKILCETLRMHNPAFTLNRVCTNDFKLPPQYPDEQNGVVIPVGTVVIIPLAGVHYDSNYYTNPNTFEPNRFNDAESQSRPKIAWMGFGEGPRNCVGSKFAMLQSKVGIANILANFNVELSAKTIDPPPISRKAFLLACDTGLWVHLKKRSDSLMKGATY